MFFSYKKINAAKPDNDDPAEDRNYANEAVDKQRKEKLKDNGRL